MEKNKTSTGIQTEFDEIDNLVDNMPEDAVLRQYCWFIGTEKAA